VLFFLSKLLFYFYLNNQNEVARAIELREIVTSLGPAYVKLGQALSIRPDILSPAAMIELQKLCDKVTSYNISSLFSIAITVCH
jgi:aarF domain-containing kinase